MITTWRKELKRALEDNNETWESIVYTTLSNEDMDVEFEEQGSCIQEEPFTLWTKDFVYFPAPYEGWEWVSSVPRNPKYIKTKTYRWII